LQFFHGLKSLNPPAIITFIHIRKATKAERMKEIKNKHKEIKKERSTPIWI
jgi:hypothetical protein